jgi:cyclase
MIAAVRAAVTVPVIASGGAGEVAHFAPAIAAGADAVLAASVFHFGGLTVAGVKDALAAAGYPVRHPPAALPPPHFPSHTERRHARWARG